MSQKSSVPQAVSFVSQALKQDTQLIVSGREAVGTTVRSVSARTSWVAIELTPPAPPMMSTTGAAPATGLRMSMRSNEASHAVIDVSGKAAALANPSERGIRPTMRSSQDETQRWCRNG